MITQILKEKSPRFTIRFPLENKDLVMCSFTATMPIMNDGQLCGVRANSLAQKWRTADGNDTCTWRKCRCKQ